MKSLFTALALATLIAPPAFTQSANEAPRTKSCGSQDDSDGRYPGYPPTRCYRW
jgi:hypothetical protein